ncbi:hypothetical protein [Sessilibacter sp. MAH2]
MNDTIEEYQCEQRQCEQHRWNEQHQQESSSSEVMGGCRLSRVYDCHDYKSHPLKQVNLQPLTIAT